MGNCHNNDCCCSKEGNLNNKTIEQLVSFHSSHSVQHSIHNSFGQKNDNQDNKENISLQENSLSSLSSKQSSSFQFENDDGIPIDYEQSKNLIQATKKNPDKLKKLPLLTLENGILYIGQWKNGLQNGKGKQIWPDGTIYIGDWKEGKAYGHGRLVHCEGDVYEGSWCSDKANGHGKYQHQKGVTYEGQMKNDKQHGIGLEVWIDGTRFEGEYQDGSKNGKGKLQFSDGSSYEGEFQNNQIEGYGVYTWKEGKIYEGYWKGNKMNGKGRLEWPDGKKYVGDHLDDKKHGFGKFIWADGRKYKGYWENGKQHGRGIFIDIHKQKKKKMNSNSQEIIKSNKEKQEVSDASQAEKQFLKQEHELSNAEEKQSSSPYHYSNKIYIPQPQNRQIIQNINNVEKQCNIYQIINPNMQEQTKAKTQSSLDFLQTLLLLSKNVSMDLSSSSTQLDSQSFIKAKKHHCNCKKTKCLKLYCECFVNKEECDASCNCIECSNNQSCSVERSQAIESILERNTNQQHSKFKNIIHSQSNNLHRGCTCKKSGCQKKYCECYNAGVPCSEFCKCEGCKNEISCKKVQLDFGTASNQPFNEELQSQYSQQSRHVHSDLHEKLLQFLQYADQLEINQQI